MNLLSTAGRSLGNTAIVSAILLAVWSVIIVRRTPS
jgi:hypothetical protein